MEVVFSYVLYGSNEKYFRPLLNNIVSIERYFGCCCKIYVYAINIPDVWSDVLCGFDNVLLRFRDELADVPGSLKMMARYQAVHENRNPNTCFVFRDSDSLITEFEFTIIKHWIGSIYDFSVVRDHPSHVMPIMGGLFCCKGNGINFLRRKLKRKIFESNDFNDYGYDQVYLDMNVYRFKKNDILVYSSCGVFWGENVVDISNQGEVIGGYTDAVQVNKKKFTIIPAWIFRKLGYRGSILSVRGWHGVNVVEKISFFEGH